MSDNNPSPVTDSRAQALDEIIKSCGLENENAELAISIIKLRLKQWQEINEALRPYSNMSTTFENDLERWKGIIAQADAKERA